MGMWSGLKPLYDLYAIHQGEPKFWPEAIEKTKDFVNEALRDCADTGAEGIGKLRGLDLIELSAFLGNQYCLEDFVNSDYFVKEKHISMLVNLLRLGYKTAAGFDGSIIESEGYAYVFSGDDIDILKLCATGSNKEAGNVILRNKVDDEDY